MRENGCDNMCNSKGRWGAVGPFSCNPFYVQSIPVAIEGLFDFMCVGIQR